MAFLTVHRSYDPIQIELLGDLLRDHGLEARVTGTRHGAMIGVGQNIMEMSIQVPADQAVAATEFLEAFFEQDGADLLRDQGAFEVGGDEEEQAEDDERGQPSRLLAAGSIALMVGGSHLYCRRYYTALALFAGQLYAIQLMTQETWAIAMTGFATFLAVIAVDLVGGQIAVRRDPMPWYRQLSIGIVLVAFAVGLGAFIGPKIPEPERDEWPALNQLTPAL